MSWTAFNEGCAVDGQPVVAVTLATYGTDPDPDHPYTFNGQVAQTLLFSNSCGPGAETCGEDGTYRLSLVIPLTMPATAEPCYAQVDAVLGAPLTIVGPGGSYYSPVSRIDEGPNMLISAGTATIDTCVAPTTTTAPPVTTTTEATAPTTTTPVLPPTVPVTEAPTEVAPAQAVVASDVSATRQLPVTGAHTGVLVLLGTSLILLGAAALVLVRVRDIGGIAR
jgi:LPXTG-motif cell wall-anchored protein